jgi:hypothetical protein
VSGKVLNTLSRLVSRVGDHTTARKRSPSSKGVEWRPHTDAELRWIDAALRALILRVGEHAAGLLLRQLTMADLPPLPKTP